MSGQERPYVRVYYSIISDERFREIYHNPRVLGTWLQLLIVADAMYPALAPMPAYANRLAVKTLVETGVIELYEHQHYRVHGLASERAMRAEWGRNAAVARWHSKGNADPMLSKPSLAKPNARARARHATALPKSVQYIKDRIAAKDAGA